jgi:hypothetical protein
LGSAKKVKHQVSDSIEADAIQPKQDVVKMKKVIIVRKKIKKAKEKREFSHLANLNQTKTQYEDDQKSLGDDDLFKAPSPPPSSKPVLAAAIKAREQAEAEVAHALAKQTSPRSKRSEKKMKRKSQNSSLSHLATLNQSKTQYEDDQKSLGDNDLFEAPSLPPSSKPLLAAAIKAREQAEAEVAHALAKQTSPRSKRSEKKMKRKSQNSSLSHLAKMNQSKTQYKDDQKSLGDDNLFEAPSPPPSSKPLLAAAIKAREQAEAESRALTTQFASRKEKQAP